MSCSRAIVVLPCVGDTPPAARTKGWHPKEACAGLQRLAQAVRATEAWRGRHQRLPCGAAWGRARSIRKSARPRVAIVRASHATPRPPSVSRHKLVQLARRQVISCLALGCAVFSDHSRTTLAFPRLFSPCSPPRPLLANIRSCPHDLLRRSVLSGRRAPLWRAPRTVAGPTRLGMRSTCRSCASALLQQRHNRINSVRRPGGR